MCTMRMRAPLLCRPQILLLALPLTIQPPAFVRRFLRFSMVAAAEYFPGGGSAQMGAQGAAAKAAFNPCFVPRCISLRCSSLAVKIIYEDREAFRQGTPYVIGYEPHSVMPQGICTFCPCERWTRLPLQLAVLLLGFAAAPTLTPHLPVSIPTGRRH